VYGLLNTTTFEPNPDFYALLLWKKVMGTKVLNVTSSVSDLRVYAHCSSVFVRDVVLGRVFPCLLFAVCCVLKGEMA
jgi:hypothetical protein